MSEIGPDRLETVTAAAVGDARRLTTKEKVKALLGVTTPADDTLLDDLIDRVSADCASYCNLAADGGGAFATFGAETLSATWYNLDRCRDDILLLPWRPKLEVTSVAENDVVLVLDTDYRVLDGGQLQRLSGGLPTMWTPHWKVVVEMTAGWSLPSGVDPALEGRVIEQVKLQYQGRKRDQAIRSQAVPDTYQVSYAVVGGDSIGESGLLVSLEAALDRYARVSI